VCGVCDHDGAQAVDDHILDMKRQHDAKIQELKVWCMVYGVWCMVYGVWCMVYGVWCMTGQCKWWVYGGYVVYHRTV